MQTLNGKRTKQQAVYEALAVSPANVEDIVGITGLPVLAVRSAIYDLRKRGSIVSQRVRYRGVIHHAVPNAYPKDRRCPQCGR